MAPCCHRSSFFSGTDSTKSSSDVVPHAGVVYESSTGEHLSKKHVAEKKEDQAEVSFRSGLRAVITAFDGKTVLISFV